MSFELFKKKTVLPAQNPAYGPVRGRGGDHFDDEAQPPPSQGRRPSPRAPLTSHRRPSETGFCPACRWRSPPNPPGRACPWHAIEFSDIDSF